MLLVAYSAERLIRESDDAPPISGRPMLLSGRALIFLILLGPAALAGSGEDSQRD